MDWTAGYASDVEYTAGFYDEQSPSHLNLVCVLNGYRPVSISESFTYFELGFGRGLTVNVLAAANPQGRFYAADFNPAHVVAASELAAEAGLPNLTVLEKSFAELATDEDANLPQFDFITLHGIYTWVTEENQKHIVNFIARYLKPGGIVYLGYNSMPGWSAVLPLQKLLVEYASAFPNQSNVQVDGAAAMVEAMEKAGARYLIANPTIRGRVDELKKGNRNYLVHEYMHKHWSPRYHADVARDLAVAKMDFVGAADLPLAYENLYLNNEQLNSINSMPDKVMRETMKDYFLNTSFRKDVFVKGARKLNPIKQNEYLAMVGAVLLKQKNAIELNFNLSIGEVKGRPELFNPVLDALEKKPQTIDELIATLGLQQTEVGNLAQIFVLLSASGAVRLYWACQQQSVSNAHAMNRAIAASSRYGDEYQVFASPVCGSGLTVNFVERLVYLLGLEPSIEFKPESLAPKVWELIKMQERRMVKDGETLESDMDNLKEVLRQINELFDNRLTVWDQLRIR